MILGEVCLLTNDVRKLGFTGKIDMDNNMLLPLQQLLTAAYQEVRECNAYSGNFGLVFIEYERNGRTIVMRKALK